MQKSFVGNKVWLLPEWQNATQFDSFSDLPWKLLRVCVSSYRLKCCCGYLFIAVLSCLYEDLMWVGGSFLLPVPLGIAKKTTSGG